MFVDCYRCEEEFAVGDWVLLDASNLSIPGVYKLRYWFMGLFIVTAHIGEVAYHLDLKGWVTCIHPFFHVSLLHRFVGDGDGI